MANRAHRWPGDNTPLTGAHGGSAAAARLAVKESKRLLHEWAMASARRVIARDLARSDAARQDRLRPRRALLQCEQARSLAHMVWEACGGVCVYCHKPMLRMDDDPLSFSIDHVLPKSRGGSNRIENLAGAHKRCNNEKGSLTGDEYRLVLAARQ